MNDRSTGQPACETCGNHYDKSFTVITGGSRHHFDCIECAAHALAPTCGHCGCRILGHGVENAGSLFCCAHCARESGEQRLVDRR